MLWAVLLVTETLAANADVRWVGDGRLMVDGRMLVEVETGEATPLLYPTRRTHAAGGHTELAVAISRSNQVALVDAQGGGVFLGLLDGALVSRAPLPVLIEGLDPAEAVHAPLWVDDRRLMIRQASRETGEGACALLDAATQAWSPPIDCPPTDFALTHGYVPGPRGWTAVHSSGEGANAVQLIRWDPEQGLSDSRTLSLDPTTMQQGSLDVFFTGDGGVRLLAPCGVDGTGCEEPGARWLYAWMPGGDLRLVRSDIPEGVVPSGSSDDFAWVEGDMVCLGDPTGERRCLPLRHTR